MKPYIALKKVKYIHNLLHEHSILRSVIKYMDKDRDAQGAYLENCKKRLITIEETFDKLLK